MAWKKKEIIYACSFTSLRPPAHCIVFSKVRAELPSVNPPKIPSQTHPEIGFISLSRCFWTQPSWQSRSIFTQVSPWSLKTISRLSIDSLLLHYDRSHFIIPVSCCLSPPILACIVFSISYLDCLDRGSSGKNKCFLFLGLKERPWANFWCQCSWLL